MAQGSAARRAEQAARERLAGLLIGAVGELGVAVAARETAAAGMPPAQERAREHVRRAQREAQEMVAAARAQVAAADDGYRAAHQAATDAGWSAAALGDMGYPAPLRQRTFTTLGWRRRTRMQHPPPRSLPTTMAGRPSRRKRRRSAQRTGQPGRRLSLGREH